VPRQTRKYTRDPESLQAVYGLSIDRSKDSFAGGEAQHYTECGARHKIVLPRGARSSGAHAR